MADFKCIPVLVDAATGKQIDEFGVVARDNDFFRLLFDETAILCCQFYDVDRSEGAAQLTQHPLDPDLTVAAFGDSDFDPETSFMFLSSQTEGSDNMVNLPNDWLDSTTADPAQGRLSFRINTNTDRFAAVLANSSSSQNFYFCITGVPAGQTAKTVLAYFRFKAENRPTSSVGAPANSDPEYLTAQEVQALVKSAPDFQFSVDGETDWHETQTDDDRYYREQRNGGEWSDAVALIEPTDAFVYVAYASDNAGTDFSLIPSDNLKYRAEIHVAEEIAAPSADDFASATWVKYLGDTGVQGETGTGVAPQGAYVSGTTYALNEGVTYGGSYYRSLADDNTGNQPDSSPTYWELMIAKGNTGATGPAGADGEDGADGANGTGVAPQGAYASETTYALNEGVTYDGSYYRSLAGNNTGNQPDNSPTYWELMIAKGDAGDQGEQGETGPAGAVGANGTGVAPQGAYAYGTTYALNEGVTYDGSYYRSLSDNNTGNQPDTSPAYWELMIAKGDTGDQGEQGETGPAGADGADWFMVWPANSIPQDINTAKWTNITAFPPINYDDFNFPVYDVDYATAEGLGLFLIEIPANTTNLVMKILAGPETPGATGDNMEWEMDFCIYRAGSAEGTVTNYTLGTTAFNAAGDTESSYSVALSSLTDGTLTAQAGDLLAIVLYPNTTDASSPKQCDWKVRQIRFEVS
ncbi:MAG: hypothetical protein PHV59_00350 [Victivallales bacterium]|nr:hypothetical protein [Victivallales bacterium]